MMPSTTKERPILFSGPMIQTLLDGRKTQTRRAVKGTEDFDDFIRDVDPDEGPFWRFSLSDGGATQCAERDCPYGQPGDRLWVREAFIVGHRMEGGESIYCDEDGRELPETVWYRADNEEFCWTDDEGRRTETVPWKSPIFMPRWASRLTLEITEVRVERLHEITEADALAEGCDGDCPIGYIPAYQAGPLRYHYSQVWVSINGPGSWDANPWVWAIEFRRLDPAALRP